MNEAALINKSVRIRSQERIYKVLDTAGGTALCKAADSGSIEVFQITDLTPHSLVLTQVGSVLNKLSSNSSAGREMTVPVHLFAGIIGGIAGLGSAIVFLDGVWPLLLGYIVGGLVGVLASALCVAANPAARVRTHHIMQSLRRQSWRSGRVHRI